MEYIQSLLTKNRIFVVRCGDSGHGSGIRGHAGKNDNENHEMVGSDFLQSFVGKMVGKEKIFLNNLLNFRTWRQSQV